MLRGAGLGAARACSGCVARKREVIAARCTCWCRAVGFDVLAGFPTPVGGALGAEACPAGEGGDEI